MFKNKDKRSYLYFKGHETAPKQAFYVLNRISKATHSLVYITPLQGLLTKVQAGEIGSYPKPFSSQSDKPSLQALPVDNVYLGGCIRTGGVGKYISLYQKRLYAKANLSITKAIGKKNIYSHKHLSTNKYYFNNRTGNAWILNSPRRVEEHMKSPFFVPNIFGNFVYKPFLTKISKRDQQYNTDYNYKEKDIDKDKVVSITYEEIGLFPRSFSRVLDRFLKQLFSDVDQLVIQEYRFYRYLFLTTIKTIFILLFVPFVVNFLAKNYLVKPITEYFWNTQQEIFLNKNMQKRAFAELQEFEEKIYFEALVQAKQSKTMVSGVNSSSTIINHQNTPLLQLDNNNKNKNNYNIGEQETNNNGSNIISSDTTKRMLNPLLPFWQLDPSSLLDKTYLSILPLSGVGQKEAKAFINGAAFAKVTTIDIERQLQEKTVIAAIYYNNHSIEAITSFFADFLSLGALLYLFITLEIQINITKSFLAEVFFGLDDSKKSLLILIVTDLLVGYHSSNLWELFFGFIFDHYGIPESQTGIFLLVATLPVLLDVLFKYLIFRHLNRSSPATVATYHAILE